MNKTINRVIIILIALSLIILPANAETITIGHADSYYQDYLGDWYVYDNYNLSIHPCYIYINEGNNWNISRLGEYTTIPIRSWINYSFGATQINIKYIINNYSQINNLVTKVNATTWYLTTPFTASHVKSITDELIDMNLFKRTLNFMAVDSNNMTYSVFNKVVSNDIRVYFNPNDFVGVTYPLTFYEKTITVKLQVADTENLGDTYVYQGDPNTNFGTYSLLWLGLPENIYLRFNLSSIPVNVIINDAVLSLNALNSGGESTASAYHQINDTWTETSITWNNQPCPGSGCNGTAESSIVFSGTGWKDWSVTNMVTDSILNNKHNVSIFIKVAAAGLMSGIASKEYSTDTTKRPYLNITYTTVEPTPTPTPIAPGYNLTTNLTYMLENTENQTLYAVPSNDSYLLVYPFNQDLMISLLMVNCFCLLFIVLHIIYRETMK